MLDTVRLRAAIPLTPIAWGIHYVERTDSTNRIARELPHGSAVITDFQKAGRGRRGRTWLAPSGSSVLMTAVLELADGINPTAISMVAALAVQDALRDVAGLATGFKWPNDIVVDARRKVAGILLEGVALHGATRVLAGTGINCNFHADTLPGLPENATSVRAETGRIVDRERLIGTLLREIGRRHEQMLATPDAVFDDWRSGLVTVGQTVNVEGIDGTWDGVAVDVRRDGALLVRMADGTERPILAADVSIRAKE